jgi:hypothetical protein
MDLPSDAYRLTDRQTADISYSAVVLLIERRWAWHMADVD